jgi:hypothetical protein
MTLPDEYADFPPGRRLWAGNELLDRQIVDRDGRLAGKVDDLQFDEPGEAPEASAGGAGVADDGARPVLRVLLTGPGALAGQIGGAAGRWLAAVERRLGDRGEEPAGIPFGLVTGIATDVTVAASRRDLASDGGERWARDVIVAKIPGAGHAAE